MTKGFACPACGRGFSSETGFTVHRVGRFEEGHQVGKGRKAHYKVDQSNTRRCLTPNELAAKGYRQHPSTGLWGKLDAFEWAS